MSKLESLAFTNFSDFQNYNWFVSVDDSSEYFKNQPAQLTLQNPIKYKDLI